MTIKCERTEKLSKHFESGGLFTAWTHNGSITITGGNGNECHITAKIQAKAATEQKAQSLAQAVKVKLESDDNKLTVEIDKPPLSSNQSIAVDLGVILPKQTDLELVSYNGGIQISNVTGDIESTTHNGSITSSNISGNIQLQTHNGMVKITYAQTAPNVRNVDITTYNGSISLATPPDFSAMANISTHNGSISSELPVIKSGKTKNRIHVAIGKGEGKLRLGTHNGSIKLMSVVKE